MSLNDFFKPVDEPAPKKRQRKTPKKDLEAAVQKECLQWLLSRPEVLYIERRNTGAMQFEDGGFVKFGTDGGADIWCIVLAYLECQIPAHPVTVHVEIECKRRDGKGRLSAAQKKFKQRMLDISVPYLVVTSAEELAEKFQELGLTD